MRKSILAILTAFISLHSYGQGSNTTTGSPNASATQQALSPGKSSKVKSEANGSTNRVNMESIEGDKNASVQTNTAGNSSVSVQAVNSAGNVGQIIVGGAGNVNINADNNSGLKYLQSNFGSDSVTIRNYDDDNADETLLKIKPISLEQIVKKGDGTQKIKVFYDWTKSETKVVNGTDSSLRLNTAITVKDQVISGDIKERFFLDPNFAEEGTSWRSTNTSTEDDMYIQLSQLDGISLRAQNTLSGNDGNINITQSSVSTNVTDGTNTTTESINATNYELQNRQNNLYSSIASSIDNISLYCDDELGNYSHIDITKEHLLFQSTTDIDGLTGTKSTIDASKSEIVSTDGVKTGRNTLTPEFSDLRLEDGTNGTGIYVTAQSFDIGSENGTQDVSLNVNPLSSTIYSTDGSSGYGEFITSFENIKSTVSADGNRITQTITPAIYEVVADSPGSSEQGIIYADATLVNTYVADTEFSSGEVITRDKSETTVTDVGAGYTTTVTTTPTESKSVNTQDGFVGTVRASAETSYLRSDLPDGGFSIIGTSSGGISTESSDPSTGNATFGAQNPNLYFLHSTVGDWQSLISIDPATVEEGTVLLNRNTSTGQMMKFEVNQADLSMNAGDGSTNFSKVLTNPLGTTTESSSGSTKISKLVVAPDSVVQYTIGASNQKSIQKSTATNWTSTVSNNLATNSITQDASNTTLNAETIYLFAGASGIEASNTSLELNSDIVNYSGSEVARKNDTGWGSYRDNQYTSGAPFTILTGVTSTLPNNAATVINSELPAGVTTFYNSGTSKLTPQLDGDYNIFTIRFKAKNSATLGGYMDFGIDIAGSLGVIFKETLTFPKGAGVEHNFTITCPGYSAATFVANGGLVKLTAGGGDLTIYDIEYQITRVHKKI